MGERIIADLLTKNKIKWKKEISFEDLKGKGKTLLRYDFGIYKDNKLVCIVEYDGEPHFNYIPFFHRNEFNFRQRKEMDRKKNSYCLARNIPLIRIPYWELENLTFEAIFNEDRYRVKNLWHNDTLKIGG